MERCHAVVVSFHGGIHFQPCAIPDYCYEVGHAAVNAGGPCPGRAPAHPEGGRNLQGQGDLLLDRELRLELAPEYLKEDGGADVLRKLLKLYGVRPDPEYPAYPMHSEGKASIAALVKASISRNGIERVDFIPVYINRDAEPEVYGQLDARGQEIFDYLRNLTEGEDLTCAFRWHGDEVVIDTSVTA